MIFDVESGLISSETQSFFADLAGNFSLVYGTGIPFFFKQAPVLNPSDLLFPLFTQFRPHNNGSIWLDWTESEKETGHWEDRFAVSLVDRCFQAANEICRRTNEYNLLILSSPSVDPGWTELFYAKFQSAFSVTICSRSNPEQLSEKPG